MLFFEQHPSYSSNEVRSFADAGAMVLSRGRSFEQYCSRRPSADENCYRWFSFAAARSNNNSGAQDSALCRIRTLAAAGVLAIA